MASNVPTLFLNLHAADPDATEKFFKALEFAFIPEYSEAKTKSFRLPAPNDKVCLMVHAHDRFKEFIRPGTQLTDAHKTTESLISIAVDGKEHVDAWIKKAVDAGGKADPYVMKDYGAECGMYTRSFADLDGHIWEVLVMLGECGK
jgi:predicted lactoylglutathione lyase